MSDSKPLASLSPSLLARKGQAKPAMRPQAMLTSQNLSHSLEDLGWNDMGHADEHTAEPVALPGVDALPDAGPGIVQLQQAEIAQEFAAPEVAPVLTIPHRQGNSKPTQSPARAPRAAAGSSGKAAFTLRLDPERHLQLRLVCAVKHRSAQQMVTQALDEFLARQPEIVDLAAQARK